ncbi:MAG TPA: cob(I)yrinic acid a,c-diamide adenosyltransferase [Bacillota bacterium]|nr:cob(I)yrinic acid a,c-diamide adenosyltransferase [Bacillota bacterium]
MNPGLIQVYTGDGKGKTTAAFGLAIRAWGRGLRVAIFQMLKPGNSTGEQLALAGLKPEIRIYPLGNGRFIYGREPEASEIEQTIDGWQDLVALATSGAVDLLIIDEISHAINCGLIEIDRVTAFLSNKPEILEVVLTGRAMPVPILEMADLITEMKAIKHPYQKGIAAREGIEY